MRLLSILSLTVFLISGCDISENNTDHSKTTFEDFKKFPTQELIGFNTDLLKNEVLLAVDMMIVDSLLIIDKFIPDPYYYSIFDLKSMTKVGAFGVPGSGPGELLDISFLSSSQAEDGNIRFMVPNAGGKVFELNLYDFLRDSTILPKEKGKLGYFHNEKFAEVDDGYLTLSSRSKDRLVKLNDIGDVIDSGVGFPFTGKLPDLPEDLMGMAYQAFMVKNTDLERVMVLTRRSLNWDVISYKDSIESVFKTHLSYPKAINTSGQSGNTKKRGVAFSSDNVNGVVHATSNKEYVYGLYSGRTYEEYEGRENFGDVVLVLDWEGNLVKKIKLDMETYCLTVSPDNKFLYTLVENRENNEIRAYDLSLLNLE